jgi:hypothetical protein
LPAGGELRLIQIKPLGARQAHYANMEVVMSRLATGPSIATALFLLLLLPGAQAADAQRGRTLYESRCDSCHDTSVHQRSARKAVTYQGVREEVVRWNRNLGGAWTDEEIDDVTLHLNERFYNFRCPEAICGIKRSEAPTPAGGALAATRKPHGSY